MLVWLTLPFYDFCGFRSVAVNSVYKLQFSTFIFADLLPVLSRLLIMSINTTIWFFKMAAVRHLRFLNVRNMSCWSGVLFTIMCVRTQKFLSYTSSAIFRTCYSLSVCKNCPSTCSPRWSYSIRLHHQGGAHGGRAPAKIVKAPAKITRLIIFHLGCKIKIWVFLGIFGL